MHVCLVCLCYTQPLLCPSRCCSPLLLSILALSVRLIVMTHDATLGCVNVCMCMLLFFVCFVVHHYPRHYDTSSSTVSRDNRASASLFSLCANLLASGGSSLFTIRPLTSSLKCRRTKWPSSTLPSSCAVSCISSPCVTLSLPSKIRRSKYP